METFEFRKGLYLLGTHFSHSEVAKLKFMCDDDLPRGALERARTAFDIFILMEDKDLVRQQDLEYLEEIMETVGKKHLVRKYLPAVGIQVVQGDHPEYSKPASGKESRMFKAFLGDLANNFSKSNIRDVSFFFYHPDVLSFQEAESMTSADTLFSELKTKGVLGVNNLHQLRKVLYVIGRKDLCNLIDEQIEAEPKPKAPHQVMDSVTVQPQQEQGQPETIYSPEYPSSAFSSFPSSGSTNVTSSSFTTCATSGQSRSSVHTGSTNYTTSTGVSTPSSESTGVLESSPSPKSTMVFSNQKSVHTDYPQHDSLPMDTLDEEVESSPMETEREPTKMIMALQLSEQEFKICEQQHEIDQLKQQHKVLAVEKQDRVHQEQEVKKLRESLGVKIKEVGELRSEKNHLLQAFYKADGSYYEMKQKPHGLAIIIVNKEFKPNSLDPLLKLNFRSGADTDRTLFQETFRSVNYDVEVYENLTGMQMHDIMDKAAKRDHTHYDSFVCCVSTHGDEQVMYGSDSVVAKRNEFIDHIRSCKTLTHKPKMFFIQACRTPTSHSTTLPQPSAVSLDPTSSLPLEADIFVANATTSGNAAYNSLQGSWFVRAVRNVFVDKAHTLSLAHLMYAVNHQVCDAKGHLKNDDGEVKIVQQCAEWTTSLRMEVRFFEPMALPITH